jgi:hypothetical protein
MNDSNPVNFAVTSQPLPSGWLDRDIGAVGVAGNATYANSVFTTKGAGQQIYATADSFHFVYQPLSGDGTLVARLASFQGGSGYATAGVMIRETLDPASTNAFTADWVNYNEFLFDDRATAAASTTASTALTGTPPYWLKVVRSGNTFTSFTSPDGVNWTPLGASQTITMAQNVFIGLAVNSGTTTSLGTATFDNVTITNP